MTQPETNTGLPVEFDSVRMRNNLVLVAPRGGATSNKVLKTTYCINKIKNGYKDVEKKSSCLRISSKSRDVVRDNHKQRWSTMFIICMMYKASHMNN